MRGCKDSKPGEVLAIEERGDSNLIEGIGSEEEAENLWVGDEADVRVDIPWLDPVSSALLILIPQRGNSSLCFFS